MKGYVTDSLEKSVVLMGHGLGGATAVITAQKKPERVRGVIALDPWLHVLKNEQRERKEGSQLADEHYRLFTPICCVVSEYFQSTHLFEGQSNWVYTKALFTKN